MQTNSEYYMSDENIDFATMQAIITAESVTVHASEIHGVITGLVCSGFSFDDQSYLVMINDLFNNSEAMPKKVSQAIKQLFSDVWANILDDSYSFQMLLPDDDDSIAERGNALSMWVQGFNLGFGLQQKDNKSMTDDVKEVLTDFVEIANLSDELEEDEDTEQAFFEIAEYVRISALLCFTELGTPPSADAQPNNKTIH